MSTNTNPHSYSYKIPSKIIILLLNEIKQHKSVGQFKTQLDLEFDLNKRNTLNRTNNASI